MTDLSSKLNLHTKEGIQEIRISKNEKVKDPYRFCFFSSLRLILEEGAELTFIEDLTGLDDGRHPLEEQRALHVELMAGAKLTYTRMGYATTWKHRRTAIDHFHLYQDAQLQYFDVSLASNETRLESTIELHEEGASVQMQTLNLLAQTENKNIQAQIIHHAPRTNVHQAAKNIMSGESKGVFHGRIHVKPQSQEVTSKQLIKTILLSPKAHFLSEPQLLIEADNVSCAHGATYGQFQDEEIFYLESRGISPLKAKRLLAMGHFHEALIDLKDEQGKAQIISMLSEKMDQILRSENKEPRP